MSFSTLTTKHIGWMAKMAVLGGVIWPPTAVWSAEGDAPKRPYMVIAQQQPDRSEGQDDPREKGKARGDRGQRDDQERPRGGGQERQGGDQGKGRAEQERQRGDQDKARAEQERQRSDQGKARADQGDKRAPRDGEGGGGVREKAAQEQLQRERERLGSERARYQDERQRFEQERRRDGRERPADAASGGRERELREQDRRLKAAEERLKFRDADQRRWRDRGRTQDSAFQRIDDVKRNRRERVEGGRTIIEEADKRVIVRDGGRTIIRHNEVERYRRLGFEVQSQKRNNGVVASIVRRPGGIEIITEHSPEGLLLRRYRRERGREISLIDNRRHYSRGDGQRWRQDDARFTVAEVRVPRVEIPFDKYVVEYGAASDEDLYEALIAPPIERLTRSYSLDEVRYTQSLRAHMRRVDLDDITFDFGSWELDGDSYRKLERLARAIQRVIDERTDEVFLIEGHTDAVGSDVDNLSLSDRRAESVAIVLTETFGIPPENLTTQGYGEQYLKVSTEDAERANRRVALRRITPLISQRSSGPGSDR